MRHVAVALLRLPDDRLVFQRRDGNAPISPNLLGFFGGRVEPGETPADAVLRELGEETSIDLTQLELTPVATYRYDRHAPDVEATFHLYEARLQDARFEVFEGSGLEVYALAEALKRSDIAPAADHVLRNIIGES